MKGQANVLPITPWPGTLQRNLHTHRTTNTLGLDDRKRCGDQGRNERLGRCGRQGQDSSRPATHSRREGGPNLGQPEAPLTALCSNVPSPSRLAGFRHSPCTCSLPENTGDQWRARRPVVVVISASITPFPFESVRTDSRMTQIITYAYLTKCSRGMSSVEVERGGTGGTACEVRIPLGPRAAYFR